MSLLLLFNQPSAGFQTYVDAFAETLVVSDGVGSKGAYVSALSESTALNAAFSAVQVFASTLGEGVSLAESYATKGVFNAELVAQLTLADQLVGGISYTDTLTEQVTLSDGAVVRTVLAASLGEAIAVADSLGATHIQVSSLGETLLLNATVEGVRVGLTWPTPSEVLLGVQYGPTGADFTGTAVAGGGATVFAEHMVVTLTIDKMTVAQKPKREASGAVEPRTAQQSSKGKNAFVCTATPTHYVLTSNDEIWVRTNKETIGH